MRDRNKDSRIAVHQIHPLGLLLGASLILLQSMAWPSQEELEIDWMRGKHSFTVTGLAFSPDGLELVTISDDWTAKRWSVAEGRLLESFGLPFHTSDDKVRNVSWSPTGNEIAFSSLHGNLHNKVWILDTASGAITELEVDGTIRSLAWGRNGEVLLVGRDQPHILIVSGGRITGSLGGHWGSNRDLAVSTDGNLVAAGTLGSTAHLWDLTTGRLSLTVGGHSRWTNVAISPDGTLLATTDESYVRIWQVSDGELLATYDVSDSGLDHVAFVDDETILYTTGLGVDCRSIATGEILFTTMGPRHGPKCLAVSLEQESFAVGGSLGHVEVRSARTGALQKNLVPNPFHAARIARSPNGARVLVGGLTTSIEVLDAGTSALITTIELPQPPPPSLEQLSDPVYFPPPTRVFEAVFSVDSAHVLGGCTEGRVRKWDVATGAQLACFEIGGDVDVWSIAAFPDGQRAICALSDGTAKVIQLADGTILHSLPAHEEEAVRRVAVAPGGALAATGGTGFLKLWNTASGAFVRDFLPAMSMSRLDFSPDGSMLAASGTDGIVRVWRVDDASLVHELTHPIGGGPSTSPTWCVRFSPDGSKLVSVSEQLVRFWDAQSGSPLDWIIPESRWAQDAVWLGEDRLILGRSDGTLVALRRP